AVPVLHEPVPRPREAAALRARRQPQRVVLDDDAAVVVTPEHPHDLADVAALRVVDIQADRDVVAVDGHGVRVVPVRADLQPSELAAVEEPDDLFADGRLPPVDLRIRLRDQLVQRRPPALAVPRRIAPDLVVRTLRWWWGLRRG